MSNKDGSEQRGSGDRRKVTDPGFAGTERRKSDRRKGDSADKAYEAAADEVIGKAGDLA